MITDLKNSQVNGVREIVTPQTLGNLSPPAPKRRVTVDRLVTGALESAFHDMVSYTKKAVSYTHVLLLDCQLFFAVM